MRARAIVFGAAALAVSAVAAQAQARPGQYGGGFVEYLLTGGGMAARPGPGQPAPRGAVAPGERMAGYGPGAAGIPAGYGDPASVYPQRPVPARHAALQGNPYETFDPIARMPEPDERPEPRAARPAPYDPGAAPIARAPDPRFGRQVVPYEGRQRPGTIVIDTGSRYLYLVQPGGQAIRYGIGVGRPGFLWHGTKTISAKKEWPDWTPPPEMMQRRPDLPAHMVGGPENPLGARALYLGSSLYRIHGTNEPHTIGQAVSSGCIRMMNEDVVDLYERTPVGTRVEVI